MKSEQVPLVNFFEKLFKSTPGGNHTHRHPTLQVFGNLRVVRKNQIAHSINSVRLCAAVACQKLLRKIGYAVIDARLRGFLFLDNLESCAVGDRSR